jgi:hypothetical protein
MEASYSRAGSVRQARAGRSTGRPRWAILRVVVVPLLALVLAAGAAPVEVPLGARDVPVRIDLDLRTAEAPPAPPLAWHTRPDGTLAGASRGPGWDATVRLEPLPGGARAISVEVRWRAAAVLELAAVRLAWPVPAAGREAAGAGGPGVVSALRPDLSFGPARGPIRVGRGTPLLAEAGGVVIAGGPGLAGARVASAAGGREAEVTLFLDDPDDRPFRTYPSCLARLPTANGHVLFGSIERRDAARGARRAAGDVDAGRAVLFPAAPGAGFLPVVPERWPRGARAAIVFTDHADRTGAAALRAVLWGTSDPDARGRPGSGFLGRGVRITRTFFVHAPSGGLDDPEIVLLARDLAEAGSEVALHSVSPGPDDRDSVRAGLAAAAPWHPVTWIDHEPYTNCEAVSSEGWRAEGRYAIRDLLVRAGIRWVWAAGDVAGFGPPRVENLFGGDPARPRAPVYPLPFEPRLWAFESSMFYDRPAALAAALSDAALASLERERGLFVAHTYLGAAPEKTKEADHLARLAVRPRAGGGFEIDPDLDGALGRIAARARAGTLASLTWAEAGDRLRALGEVEVAYRADGAAEVVNEGDARIEGLTVAIPAPGLEVTADGGPPLGRSDDPGVTRVWFDLDPGQLVVLRAWQDLRPVPFLGAP